MATRSRGHPTNERSTSPPSPPDPSSSSWLEGGRAHPPTCRLTPLLPIAPMCVFQAAVQGWARNSGSPSDPPFLSTGAATELADLARRIRIGHAISPVASEALVDLLRLNTDLSMVAAAFGLDPLAHVDEDLGVRLINKTGTQTGSRADVGCVEATVAGEWRLVSYAVIARFEDAAPTRRSVLDAMRAVGEQIAGQL